MKLQKKAKFYFEVESIADLNTIKGFIQILRINPKCVTVGCRHLEMSASIVKSVLKGCSICPAREKNSDRIRVIFTTEGRERLRGTRCLIANYDPYKYVSVIDKGKTKNEKKSLRTAMGIQKTRKIIFVSCTDRREVIAVIRAWQRLKSLKTALLVFALRKPEKSLTNSLSQKGLRVHERYSRGQSLRHFGKSDIVILNTMGELFKLLASADLAIVGHDRNIFEPAIHGIPVFYFAEPLGMNKKEKALARHFKLFWRKNLTAKKLLDKFGGASRIELIALHRQMNRVLKYPQRMIRGTQKAVQAFRRHIIPSKRAEASNLLRKALAV